MKWQHKAFLQKIISSLPFSQQLNYFLQRRVNKSLPMSDAVLEQKKINAQLHLKAFKSHDGDIPEDATVYEFGGGYDLAIPLLLAKHGVKNQLVTDRNSLLKLDLIKDTAERLGIKTPINTLNDIKQLSIEYKIIKDASATGFNTASFDFIHSTDTLEHFKKQEISKTLQECYRLLKAGGIISCVIDLQDHYQYSDPSISPFNFYQYSGDEWNSKYNNRLYHYNRLLANEYYTLFAMAGFAPIQIQFTKASDEQIEELKKLNLHADFANKPIDEINNLRCHIWAEKPD